MSNAGIGIQQIGRDEVMICGYQSVMKHIITHTIDRLNIVEKVSPTLVLLIGRSSMPHSYRFGVHQLT